MVKSKEGEGHVVSPRTEVKMEIEKQAEAIPTQVNQLKEKIDAEIELLNS